MPDERLTTQQAADLAACTRQNVLYAIRTGHLRSTLIRHEGRMVYRVERADVLQWIAGSAELCYRRERNG